jgi:lipoprotein-anchoring transpeptidase ErfK/SrfK
MKALLATTGFSLGGAAAAALFGHGQQPSRAVTAPVSVHAQAAAGRIAVTPAELRQAYADGLIDHPITSLLDVRQRMSYGDYRWDDKGVPAGPTWIRVDLKSQLISVFRSGEEIGTAVILYGADGVPTPTGKFPILAKMKDHTSATYDNAPMPYTLRLRADGVSIHGSNVRWGFATHGCVGVPVAFAAKLFDAVKTGDEVLIVGAERSPKRVA